MELNQDWRYLQSVFFPEALKASHAAGLSDSVKPIYCIHEEGTIVEVFSEGQTFSEWLGASVAELRADFQSRLIFELDRKTLDSIVAQSLSQPHLEAQITQWRSEAWSNTEISLRGESRGRSKARQDLETFSTSFVSRKHFILEMLHDSWWLRVLPSSFGVVFRFDDGVDFLLVHRKERLDQFGVPDLSFLPVERRGDFAAVVKGLSERLSLPVQGLMVSRQDWARWPGAQKPWAELARAIQTRQVQLVPFRWGVVSMIALRGFLGL